MKELAWVAIKLFTEGIIFLFVIIGVWHLLGFNNDKWLTELAYFECIHKTGLFADCNGDCDCSKLLESLKQ